MADRPTNRQKQPTDRVKGKFNFKYKVDPFLSEEKVIKVLKLNGFKSKPETLLGKWIVDVCIHDRDKQCVFTRIDQSPVS